MEAKYCVYGHYDDRGICFYVGIGDKKRPFWFYIRTSFWKNYVNKHCVSGKPEVKIWHRDLTWEQACAMEKQWIALYGRRDLGTGCLVNLTDGGEGRVGHVCSEETKAKMSQANKGEKNPQWGKPLSEEHRQKISEAHKGRPKVEETKRKLSLAQKGRTPWNKGKPLSKETRLKMSQALKGRPAHNKGKPLSKETRQKISQTKKVHEQQKKQQKTGEFI